MFCPFCHAEIIFIEEYDNDDFHQDDEDYQDDQDDQDYYQDEDLIMDCKYDILGCGSDFDDDESSTGDGKNTCDI
jgi:hypothetical protein